MFLFLRRSHPEEFCKKTTSFFFRLLFSLTHFIPLVFFYTAWNHQKSFDFQMFSRGKEWDQLHDGSSRPDMFCKKGVPRNFARVSFLIKLQAPACNFTKKETLAQVFSCVFAKFLRTPYLTEHLRWLFLTWKRLKISKKPQVLHF